MPRIGTVRIALGMLWLACLPAAAAPEVIAPARPGLRGIAVVVDRATYEADRAALEGYVRDLAARGYGGWFVVDAWDRPEPVRSAIEGLYARPEARLEGLLLVGDIPVVMARDAQFLTSAFKMDQERYEPFRSSVPTDRYYDDLDLCFEYLEPDADHPLLHYMRLDTSSAVRVRRELYSGRLTPRGGTPAERHAAIARYLSKLSTARRGEVLDRALVAMGHGYVSESTAALAAHAMELRDTLGFGAPARVRVDVLAQLFDNAVKPRLLQCWTAAALDLAVVHCHGDSDALLLDTQPAAPAADAPWADGAAPAAEPTEGDEPEPWYLWNHEVRALPCGAEVVMLDSCFTGSFADEAYLASEFLFGAPDTLVTIANSRNVRQDIWSQEPLALLRAGLSVGQAHRRVRFLESHLFGDPTYAFAGPAAAPAVLEAYASPHPHRLRALARGADDPVARGLALERLAELAGGRAEADVRTGLADPSPFVRLKALRAIVALRPTDLPVVLMARAADSDAQVRKFAVILLGDQGDPRAAETLIETAAYDPCARCRWQASQALGTLGGRFESQASRLTAGLLRQIGYPDRAEVYSTQAERQLAEPRAAWALEKLEQTDPAQRRTGVRTLRGNRYCEALPELLRLLDEEPDASVRTDVAEALGWWGLDRRRDEVVAALTRVAGADGTPEPVLRTTIIALERLETGPNEPLVP